MSNGTGKRDIRPGEGGIKEIKQGAKGKILTVDEKRTRKLAMATNMAQKQNLILKMFS
jgi:hypothetical protein